MGAGAVDVAVVILANAGDDKSSDQKILSIQFLFRLEKFVMPSKKNLEL